MDAAELTALTSRIASLECEVDELRTRVDSLDDRDDNPDDGPRSHRATRDDDPLWFVRELERREPGAVMIAGAIDDSPPGPVQWQYGRYAQDLLEMDWSDRARAIEAVSHPVRLELVRQVLRGVHTTAELMETDNLATTGQLHHHLRQLISAGWLISPKRGTYEVPAARVVPLLILVMTAGE